MLYFILYIQIYFTLRFIKMSASPANKILHVNVQLCRPTVSNLGQESSAVFRDVIRSGAIIDNPSDYYCGIERLTIPLGEIPLFIALMDPVNANGLDTQYVVSICAGPGGAVQGSAPVRLVKTPSQTVPGWQPGFLPNNYNWVYSRATLAFMLTDALARAATAGGITPAPYISYDSTTKLNTLFMYPMADWDQVISITNHTIYFNQLAANLFAGFTNSYDSQISTTQFGYVLAACNGINYLPAAGIQVPNANGNLYPAATNVLFFVKEVNPNLDIITLSSIELHSSLPAYQEYTDGSGFQDNTAVKASTPLLSDLLPDFTANADSYNQPSIYQSPGLGQMRWIQLSGKQPLSNFTLGLWWVDRDGNTRPLRAFDQSSAAKICLAHKSLIESF